MVKGEKKKGSENNWNTLVVKREGTSTRNAGKVERKKVTTRPKFFPKGREKPVWVGKRFMNKIWVGQWCPREASPAKSEEKKRPFDRRCARKARVGGGVQRVKV